MRKSVGIVLFIFAPVFFKEAFLVLNNLIGENPLLPNEKKSIG